MIHSPLHPICLRNSKWFFIGGKILWTPQKTTKFFSEKNVKIQDFEPISLYKHLVKDLQTFLFRKKFRRFLWRPQNFPTDEKPFRIT